MNYLKSLASEMVRRYNLCHKDIIEIGCGKGYFLKLLCSLAENRGIGFDPSYMEQESAGDNGTSENVTFIRDFYSDRYASYKADFVCCRHVLEHIQHPVGLVRTVRQAIEGHRTAVVFFEVPEATWILRNVAFWDICYEHCCYFTAESLGYLFARCGFNVLQTSLAFEDQYVSIEAVPWTPDPGADSQVKPKLERITEDVFYFAANVKRKISDWKYYLHSISRGRRCVVWGAAAKGVTFLNTLNVGNNEIEFVVDVNPSKEGKFIPATGQQIVAPEFLITYRPDIIFVMNSNYLKEIEGAVVRMGLIARLVSVC